MRIYQLSASKSSGFPKSVTGGGFVPEPSVERDDPCLPAPPPRICGWNPLRMWLFHRISGISMDGITVSSHSMPFQGPFFGRVYLNWEDGHQVSPTCCISAYLSCDAGHLRSCRVYTLFQKVHAFVSDSDFWTPNVGELSANNEGLRLLRWAMTSQPLKGLVVCPYVFVSCRMPLVAWKISTSMTLSMWPNQRTQAASRSFCFFVVRCATDSGDYCHII